MLHQGERTRDALVAAGLPTWAPFSPDDVEASAYVWVTDVGLRLLLVGDEGAGQRLASFCVDVLNGQEPRPAGEPATDVSTLVALAHLRADACGYGSVGRQALRPLRELLEFAAAHLGRG